MYTIQVSEALIKELEKVKRLTLEGYELTYVDIDFIFDDSVIFIALQERAEKLAKRNESLRESLRRMQDVD